MRRAFFMTLSITQYQNTNRNSAKIFLIPNHTKPQSNHTWLKYEPYR